MYGQIGGQIQAMSWLNDNFTLLPTSYWTLLENFKRKECSYYDNKPYKLYNTLSH